MRPGNITIWIFIPSKISQGWMALSLPSCTARIGRWASPESPVFAAGQSLWSSISKVLLPQPRQHPWASIIGGFKALEVFIPGAVFWRLSPGFRRRAHRPFPARDRPRDPSRPVLEMAHAGGRPPFLGETPGPGIPGGPAAVILRRADCERAHEPFGFQVPGRARVSPGHGLFS